jgi:putative oxidoreductase
MKLLRKAIEVEHWSTPATFGHLMLRVVTALMLFWFHGWHKLLEAVAFIRTGESWRLVDEIAEMHFPAPAAIAFFATAAQFICSLLLTLGLFTRLNALVLAAILGGAVLQNLLASRDPQLAILYTLILLCMAIWGGGRFSIDAILSSRLRPKGNAGEGRD